MSTMSRERMMEQKILVAVDFGTDQFMGTTFSGIAWGFTGEAGSQNMIQNWPDRNSTGRDFHGKTIDKVPTTLRYDRDRCRWGYQIDDTEKRYEWFKLGLDPSRQKETSSLAAKYPGNTQLPMQLSPEYTTSPQKLTTDYLRALRSHAEYMLLQTITEAVLRRTPREYTIAVPAVWTELARDLTISCAIDAGMGTRANLHVVSEPEAAAMYAFKEMNSCGLKEGDTFVVCDAGGGTVDLISYKVLSLQDPLEIAEATPGSGDACGSIFLNRIFAKTLNDRFAGDPDWETNSDIMATAMEHFETKTKDSFNGKHPESIPVHGLSPRPGIKKHRLELSAAELSDIFEPVVTEILKLIQQQLRDTSEEVKLILLVGGFGSSFYLRSKIEEALGKDIQVKVAPNCQTAIVRGALMKGLAEVKGVTTKLPRIRVDSRKARKHYGTECLTAYKKRTSRSNDGHSPERKIKDEFTGEYYVKYMKWFLKKGEAIRESEPAPPFGFQMDHPVKQGRPRKFSIDVYCHTDPSNTGAPAYRTNDVHKLGTVEADISDLDPNLLTKEQGHDDEEHYVLNFDIEMRCFAATIEFTPIYKYGPNGTKRFAPAKVNYI